MPEPSKPERPARGVRLVIVALAALGLLARLALALMADEDRAAGFEASEEYLAIAQSVLAGEGFVLPPADDADAAASRPALARRAPGYPLLLAAAEAVGGSPVRTTLVVQAVMGGATLVLVAWLAARLAGLWAAAAAVALMAFDPYQVYASALVGPVVPLGLALVATLAAGVKCAQAARDPSGRAWPWAAGAGLCLAAAAYVEPWAAGFAAAAGLAALVSGSRRRLLAAWALGAAVLALALAPWVVRNACRVGLPVMATDGCHRLHAGTAPASEAPAAPEGLDEAEACRFALRTGVARIREAPGAWLHLAGGRIATLWRPGPVLGSAAAFAPLAGYTSLLPAAGLALVGLVILRRRAAAWWLVLAPAYLTAVHGVLAGPASERLAVMPPLAALGGAAVAALVARTGGAAPAASASGGPPGGSPKEKA